MASSPCSMCTTAPLRRQSTRHERYPTSPVTGRSDRGAHDRIALAEQSGARNTHHRLGTPSWRATASAAAVVEEYSAQGSGINPRRFMVSCSSSRRDAVVVAILTREGAPANVTTG
jgi:hypothetical protein